MVDRPRAEGGVADFGQPVAWASAMAENCAESNAGTRGKARRSEDGDDATMPARVGGLHDDISQ